jgi:uncharacterized protein (DUF1501 family)
LSAISRQKFFADGVQDLCALAGTALLSTGLVRLAFGAEAQDEILVVLFLRGACDGLNFAPPLQGSDRAAYEAARPNLRVPTTGDKAALSLDGNLGLHPAAKPLHELFKAGKLALVQAAGLTSDSRSHFDAQAYMELGTPDRKSATSGWIARHLLGRASPAAPSFLTAVSIGNLTPNSLLGYPEIAVIDRLDGFNIAGPKNFQNDQRDVLRRMYAGGGWVDRYGRETLDAIDAFESAVPGGYRPAGRDYPRADVGNRLRTLAQIVKMDLGLKIATVDMGGWDTHKYQGDGSEGYFTNLVGQLSQSLAAFYEDLNAGPSPRKVTVVVMSEFGRRLKENASRGTDHGHGNVMLALGDKIAGGKVYGRWPGLDNEKLYQRADLAVTTDYRVVLAEILEKRLSDARVGQVFPGFDDPARLGLANAT